VQDVIPLYETQSYNWEVGPYNSNWGYAYGKGFVVLAEGLDVFRLRAIDTGWERNQPGNLSFTKGILVEWMSGSWSRNGWDPFGWRLLRVGAGGGIILDKGEELCPFFSYTLLFSLKMWKSTENLSHVSCPYYLSIIQAVPQRKHISSHLLRSSG
jgi:hypothetical protein